MPQDQSTSTSSPSISTRLKRLVTKICHHSSILDKSLCWSPSLMPSPRIRIQIHSSAKRLNGLPMVQFCFVSRRKISFSVSIWKLAWKYAKLSFGQPVILMLTACSISIIQVAYLCVCWPEIIQVKSTDIGFSHIQTSRSRTKNSVPGRSSRRSGPRYTRKANWSPWLAATTKTSSKTWWKSQKEHQSKANRKYDKVFQVISKDVWFWTN